MDASDDRGPSLRRSRGLCVSAPLRFNRFWRSHMQTTQARRKRPMPRITRDSLMTLEAYAKVRSEFRANVMAHKKNRTVAPRRAHHADVRGRDDHALPDPGDAARRAHLRGAGHPGRAGRLQPADSRRQQLEGDDADRVPRRGGAAARAGRADRRGGPGLGPGRRLPARVRDRRRGPRARERREDLLGALPALRARPGDEAGARAAGPRSGWGWTTRATRRPSTRSRSRCESRCCATCPV